MKLLPCYDSFVGVFFFADIASDSVFAIVKFRVVLRMWKVIIRGTMCWRLGVEVATERRVCCCCCCCPSALISRVFISVGVYRNFGLCCGFSGYVHGWLFCRGEWKRGC
jgi:hypothetical protein